MTTSIEGSDEGSQDSFSDRCHCRIFATPSKNFNELVKTAHSITSNSHVMSLNIFFEQVKRDMDNKDDYSLGRVFGQAYHC